MPTNTISGKRKILYMIFSVAVAIALWTYVAFTVNPMVDSPVAVYNIPVEFTDEDLLRDNNLIVSNVDVQQLTIYFGGRRSEVTKLSNENVRAVVDLKDVLSYSDPTGVHALEYELQYDNGNSGITQERASRSVVEVTVERMATDTIHLTPVYTGGFAENYMAGSLTLSRDTVEISGTEDAIARIKSATVTLDRENLSQTTTREEPIVLLDEDGSVINPEEQGLTFVNGTNTAVITQTVLMVKEIPFRVDLVEGITATDANVRVEYSTPTITLSGDPEVLEGVNEINLGTVNLKSIVLSFERAYQVVIPNNTTNLSGITTVNVTITVENMDTRRMTSGNYSYRNAPENVSVSFISKSTDIILRGKEARLETVNPENIRIVANLSEVTGYGTFTVPATVYVDGYTDVEAVSEYTVFVTVGAPAPEEPPASPEP